MMIDPIVEEIRKIRQAHAAKFGFDLDSIFEDFQAKERESGRKTVSRSPKPAKPALPRK